MSEPSALNSHKKNNDNLISKDNVNLNNNNVNSDNDRKRKNQKMNNNNAAKHFKASNYYSVLDLEKDDQCDQELLQKYEKHVNDKKK